MTSKPRVSHLLAVALALALAAVPVRHWMQARRTALMAQEPAFSSELAFRVPALVLTGLRGPLVTLLWMLAEDGKQERDWELLQTYYSAISSLQPHFAQGYVMNGWNSAYNMSVQWNALSSKYMWIRRGIDLVEEGDRRNPEHVDLVQYLSDLYGDKLGRASERIYYGMRFREETAGRSLPTLNEKNPSEKKTHPYGISPLGYGWYYSEIAWRLVRDQGQEHHQFGNRIMSSRPVLFLRDWAYQESDMARLRAQEVFGADSYEKKQFWGMLTPERQRQLEMRRNSPALIEETRWHYREAAELFDRAVAGYDDHIRRAKEKPDEPDDELYRRHAQNAWYDGQVIRGDARAFEALLIVEGRSRGTPQEAGEHFRAAEEHYRAAHGDVRKWDPAKQSEWINRVDIGMALYSDAHLPVNDLVKMEMKQTLENDMRSLREAIKIMYNCRRTVADAKGAPLSRDFTPEVLRRIRGWVILRETTKLYFESTGK